MPPSETAEADYLPFGWDYQSWFRAIGQVAVKHQAITGIAMDDIAANFTLNKTTTNSKFTLTQLSEMRDTARAANPRMLFYALVYGQDVIGATRVLPYFRSAVDDVIYAFAGPNQIRHVAQNTTNSTGLLSTTTRIRNVTDCGGVSHCWEATFGRPTRTSTVETLTALTQIKRSTHARRIKVVFADDSSGSNGFTYGIAVSADGTVLTTDGSAKDTAGHLVLSVVVPASEQNGRLKLEVRITKPAVSQTGSVFINSITLNDGEATADLIRTGSSKWSFNQSPGSKWASVKPLKLIDMFYCARFGIESTTAGAGDAAYVARLIPQIRELESNRLIDGVVAYRLNLTGTRRSALDGDPRNLKLIDQLYAR